MTLKAPYKKKTTIIHIYLTITPPGAIKNYWQTNPANDIIKISLYF